MAVANPASPSFDPAVVADWEEIKSYFRNVAAWLAPKTKQTCLRNGGWLFVLRNNEVAMTLRRGGEVEKSLAYFRQLGVFARDALGRLASQCQRRIWLCELFHLADIREFLPDPWEIDPPIPDPEPWLDSLHLEDVALGGAIHALAEAFSDETDLGRLVEGAPEEIKAVVRKGVAQSTSMLIKGMAEGTKALAAVARRMDSIAR